MLEPWKSAFRLGSKILGHVERIQEDMDLYKMSACQSGLFLKGEIPLIYLKYLLLSLVTKLPCRYYDSVSKYLFSYFVFGHLFLFQWISCVRSYLFIIFFFKHYFLLSVYWYYLREYLSTESIFRYHLMSYINIYL